MTSHVGAAILVVDPLSGSSCLVGRAALDARIGIHVRGQSTRRFPMKQYALELRADDFDAESDRPVLGLPSNSDWVLWRGGNLLGSYDEDMVLLNAGSVWLISDKQELRVRLEAIGLDAKANQAYRVAANGEPVESTEEIPNVGLRNLGFQIRYRYELAPLSYLYVAYVRGGEFYEEDIFGHYRARDEFIDAFDLRDSEQFLVKLSYRFEI